MAEILQMTSFLNAFPWEKNLIEIKRKFIPDDSINNKSSLVHVMACHQTGGKPLPEPMIT